MKNLQKYLLTSVLMASAYINSGTCTVVTKDKFGKVFFDEEQIKMQFDTVGSKEEIEKIQKHINKTTKEEKHNDCKQAYEAALKRSMEIQKKLNNVKMICTIGKYDETISNWVVDIVHERDKHWNYIEKISHIDLVGAGVSFINGEDFQDSERLYISGFAEGGLFKKGGVFVKNQGAFIYTRNTNYANGDIFDSPYVLKYVGNYKYTTVAGATRSVPAYKETKYKKTEIMPYTYKKDKSLNCAYDKRRDVAWWYGDINYRNESYARDAGF